MFLPLILASGSTSIPCVNDDTLTPTYNSPITIPTNPRNGLPLYGNIPGSDQLKYPGESYEQCLEWFESPTNFEYQHQSRGFYHRDHIPQHLNELFMKEQIKQFNKTVERLIIQRILPAPYSKTVGWNAPMFVGNLDADSWNYWLSTHSCPPTTVKEYKHKVPDREGKRSETFYSIGWEGGKYPILSTPHWYMTKWTEQNYWYIMYRGVVKTIYFVRNRFSDNVRVKFMYETHRYDSHYKRWEYC